MWDLETIHLMEQEAHLSFLRKQQMVNGEVGQTAEPGPEPVFPLAILASKLITGPPALSRLIDLLADSDSIAYFLEIVREYLPRYEADIMMGTDDSYRIRRFCHYFSNEYFPLMDMDSYYDDFTLADFTHHIPVDLLGFSSEDYESFNSFRDGFILSLSLVESPYDPGERVPILERVKELVGKTLVELIPPEGWTLQQIHEMLDGSKYEGCAAFADWVHGCTDCMQMNANYEDYGPEGWSREIVDGLTEQWPMVQDLQGKMDHMFQWLEEDIYHNFEELLARMNDTEYIPVPKEQIPFPLDDDGQVIIEEVIASGTR